MSIVSAANTIANNATAAINGIARQASTAVNSATGTTTPATTNTSTPGSSTPTSDTAATTAANQAQASSKQLTTDKTQFLTLLTAQLKNQDPLSPMDSTAFTNQLVQFSAVEQQININSNLATLISLSQQSLLSNAANYVGKPIQANISTAPLQNGTLNAAYTLSGTSQNTVITIADSTGKIVNEQTGATTAGAYSITWNGQDSTGKQLPDGAYTVNVTAVGADNKPVTTTTTVYGTVTSVTSDPTTNATTLNMGAVKVPMSDVVSVG
ncbi:MAG: flagellar hook assembly protein FlgD [Rhodospirillaceae bacterium]|nr:MAG: flagellar hook assembly protein FlgD [Rhodospirillaceae bacterium]